MRKVIYVLAIIFGGLAAVGGPLMGLVLAIVAFTGRRPGQALQSSSMGLTLAVVGLVLGGSLAWAGVQALHEVPDRPFRLPAWGWWLIACLGALALGQAVSGMRPAAQILLPFLHIIAGGSAALLFLSLAVGAARGQAGFVATRPAVGSLAWGALGGTGLGIIIEMLLLIAVAIIAALFFAIFQPDLLAQLQSWAMSQMENPGGQPDFGALSGLATSPIVVLALLTGVGVAVPLIEETVKSLAVPLVALTIHRKAAPAGTASVVKARTGMRAMTRLDGFLYGVAAGAGFGLLESMLNGSLALLSPGSWSTLMAVRAGTAAVHCLATGLGGLAWQAALAERRWLRALGLALAAVAVHGAWNVGAGVTGIAGLAGQGDPAALPFALAMQALATGGMVVLWLIAVVALPLIARNLAAAARQSAGTASTPSSMVVMPVFPEGGSLDIIGAPEAAASEGTGETPAASI